MEDGKKISRIRIKLGTPPAGADIKFSTGGSEFHCVVVSIFSLGSCGCWFGWYPVITGGFLGPSGEPQGTPPGYQPLVISIWIQIQIMKSKNACPNIFLCLRCTCLLIEHGYFRSWFLIKGCAPVKSIHILEFFSDNNSFTGVILLGDKNGKMRSICYLCATLYFWKHNKRPFYSATMTQEFMVLHSLVPTP